jgi:hypothetical protein
LIFLAMSLFLKNIFTKFIISLWKALFFIGLTISFYWLSNSIAFIPSIPTLDAYKIFWLCFFFASFIIICLNTLFVLILCINLWVVICLHFGKILDSYLSICSCCPFTHIFSGTPIH